MVMDVANYIKSILKTDQVSIDNFVFRLHYRVTVAILLASSIVGVAKQYFGDPINCQTASGVESKVLDDYCWIHSTFHIRSEYQGHVGCLVDPVLVQEKLLYSGGQTGPSYYDTPQLRLADQLTTRTPDTSFYQWVPLVLVLQAGLFYLPRRIWKSCEGGGTRISRVLLRGDHGEDSSSAQDLVRKQSSLFINSLNHNTGYFITFPMSRYGTQVMAYLSYDKTSRLEKPDPLCTVFPTVTSCSFHSVGTAAGEQKFNSLCILSLNIINEKIYLLLWFWLFSLVVVGGLQLLIRLASLLVPPVRTASLLLSTNSYRGCHAANVRSVAQHCNCSDWFVLYQLTSNNQRHLSHQLMKNLQKYFNSNQKLKIRKHSAEGRKRREFYSDDDEIYSKPSV